MTKFGATSHDYNTGLMERNLAVAVKYQGVNSLKILYSLAVFMKNDFLACDDLSLIVVLHTYSSLLKWHLGTAYISGTS